MEREYFQKLNEVYKKKKKKKKVGVGGERDREIERAACISEGRKQRATHIP